MQPQIRIGACTIDRIVEQEGVPFIDFRTFFPSVSAEMLEENRGWLAPRFLDPETGRIRISVQSYVLRAGGLTILVDTCVGNHKARPARPMWNNMASRAWEQGLAGLGLSVGDIDIVMCTHLHVDHVGWNTRLESGRWVPTFPKARYLFSGRELEFWTERSKRDPASCPWIEDSVLPIVAANRAERVGSSDWIGDDIRLLPTPGHTIDHFSVEIGRAGSGEDALIGGDMVHSPIQMKHPEIGMMSDYDSAQAGETRRRVFSRCCDAGTLLCTAHFPGNPVGRVEREGGGFRFVEC